MPKKNKKVVVIGGGTGTSALLRGLKKYPLDLTAIITTADSGGSSGKLRGDLGMAPPGDVRQCFVALNDENHPMISHFNTRFDSGALQGHTFGNLLLALLWQHNEGNFQDAIEDIEKIFDSKHSIIPVTVGPTNLVAHLKDGKKVGGEDEILNINRLDKKLKRLQLAPRAEVNPKAQDAMEAAHFIIVGPGNLFTSLTPPLLVKGVVRSIKESRAKKLYIANLTNQWLLTRDYKLQDYLDHFTEVFSEDIFDHIFYNTKQPRQRVLDKHKIKDQPLVVDRNSLDNRFLGEDLIDRRTFEPDAADLMQRNLVRHDSKKLSKAVFAVINGDT